MGNKPDPGAPKQFKSPKGINVTGKAVKTATRADHSETNSSSDELGQELPTNSVPVSRTTIGHVEGTVFDPPFFPWPRGHLPKKPGLPPDEPRFHILSVSQFGEVFDLTQPPLVVGASVDFVVSFSYPSYAGQSILVAARAGIPGVFEHPAVSFPILNGDYSTTTFSVAITDWVLPKNSNQFGATLIYFEVWAKDPGGATLPPDLASFEVAGSTWRQVLSQIRQPVYFIPGCKSTGTGDDFCNLVQFDVSPSSVQLNAAGTQSLPNQNLTVTWRIESAGYPATPNWKGSLSSLTISTLFGLPNYFFNVSPPIPADTTVVTGSVPINFGLRAWNLAAPYPTITLEFDGQPTCGVATSSVPRTIAIVGIKPPTVPAGTSVAILQFYNSFYTTTPDNMQSGEPLVATFQIRNVGTKASGGFAVHLDLDEGTDSADQSVASLDPGEATGVTWTFPDGLSAGIHSITASFENVALGTEVASGSVYIGLSLF